MDFSPYGSVTQQIFDIQVGRWAVERHGRKDTVFGTTSCQLEPPKKKSDIDTQSLHGWKEHSLPKSISLIMFRVFFPGCTLLGTNMSPEKSILKMIFLFLRWDMLIPWRVFNHFQSVFFRVYLHTVHFFELRSWIPMEPWPVPRHVWKIVVLACVGTNLCRKSAAGVEGCLEHRSWHHL